jgi:hypothetical protein
VSAVFTGSCGDVGWHPAAAIPLVAVFPLLKMVQSKATALKVLPERRASKYEISPKHLAPVQILQDRKPGAAGSELRASEG